MSATYSKISFLLSSVSVYELVFNYSLQGLVVLFLKVSPQFILGKRMTERLESYPEVRWFDTL